MSLLPPIGEVLRAKQSWQGGSTTLRNLIAFPYRRPATAEALRGVMAPVLLDLTVSAMAAPDLRKACVQLLCAAMENGCQVLNDPATLPTTDVTLFRHFLKSIVTPIALELGKTGYTVR